MFAVRSAVVVALLACGSAALAQTYPTKPVRFVTASVNSPQDLIGRVVGQKLGELWSQPVVVENRAGSGSLLSINTVQKAAPDGYTVLVTSSAYAVTPYLFANAGYDAEKDFVPVMLVASSPNIVVAHPGFAGTTLKEAVARAKQAKLHYGSPGLGTTPQISGEYLFRSLAGVTVDHIAYKGLPPLVSALFSGEVPMGIMGLSGAVPGIRSGKLRGLAVTSGRRSPAVPGVPTVAEAGFPGFEDETWVIVMLPAGSPQPVVSKLRADLQKTVAEKDVRARLAAMGFDPMDASPQETTAFLRKELAKWQRMVKETGARAE